MFTRVGRNTGTIKHGGWDVTSLGRSRILLMGPSVPLPKDYSFNLEGREFVVCEIHVVESLRSGGQQGSKNISLTGAPLHTKKSK